MTDWNGRYTAAVTAVFELLGLTPGEVELDLLPELVGLQFDGLPPARLADSLAELLGPHALRPGLPLDRLCAELPPLLSELADLFDRLMPEPGRLPGPTVPAEPAWAHALAFGATAH